METVQVLLGIIVVILLIVFNLWLPALIVLAIGFVAVVVGNIIDVYIHPWPPKK